MEKIATDIGSFENPRKGTEACPVVMPDMSKAN